MGRKCAINLIMELRSLEKATLAETLSYNYEYVTDIPATLPEVSRSF